MIYIHDLLSQKHSLVICASERRACRRVPEDHIENHLVALDVRQRRSEAKGRRCAMLDNKIYWYVLFVRTGAEERVAERLKRNPACSSFRPFVPQKTCVFRRQGQKSLFQKICFPGYVFIETELPAAEFISQAFPVVYKLREVYRFLNYGNESDIAMRDEERIVLSQVFGKESCIEISMGFKEGDSIRVISGALEGKESKILRINNNRHEAVIEINMFATATLVSVGIEIIEKTDDFVVC